MSRASRPGRWKGGNPALVKKQRDAAILRRMARDQDRQRMAAVMDGPHGRDVHALRCFLGAMALSDGRALVERVKASPLRQADDRTRLIVLRLVGDAIEKVRVKHGLPASADWLPGQPLNAFMAIRDLLRERAEPGAP